MRCPIYSTTQLARVSLKIEIHISLNRSGGSTVAHSAAAAAAVILRGSGSGTVPRCGSSI